MLQRDNMPCRGCAMNNLRELSEENLAEALELLVEGLRSIAQMSPRLYRQRKEPKKSGGFRLIEAPHANLKSVQRHLLHRILGHLSVSDCFFGKAGSSAIQAAQLHVNKPFVITMDIQDFFPSVTSRMVYGMFRRRGAEQVVARTLTRIVTRKGHLPQGAPTSPHVAMMVLNPAVDHIMAAIKPVKRAVLSVYVDDAAMSGPVGLKRMKNMIVNIFERYGFHIHPGKIRVMPATTDQEVLGLTVNRDLQVSETFRAKYEEQLAELGVAHPTVRGKRNFIDSVAKARKSA